MRKLKRIFGKLDNRKIITMGACLLVFVMALGYAALTQELDVGGIASVDRSWIVKVTDVKYEVVDGADVVTTPAYASTTVTLRSNIPTSSASIKYTVTLKNEGNIKAKLSNISVIQDENSQIKYTISGVIIDSTTLNPGEENKAVITVKYDEGLTNVANTQKDLMFTFDYVENSGIFGNDSGNAGSAAETRVFTKGEAIMFDPGTGTELLFYVLSTGDSTFAPTVDLISANLYGSVPYAGAQSTLGGVTSKWTKASSRSLPQAAMIAEASNFVFDNNSSQTYGTSTEPVIPDWLRGNYFATGNNPYKVTESGTMEPVVSVSTGNSAIRPVINVGKNLLPTHDVYLVGNKVKLLDGTQWYVTKDSGSNNSMVTLVSDQFINSDGSFNGESTYTDEFMEFDTEQYSNYNPLSDSNIGYFMDNTFLPVMKDSISNAGGDITGLNTRLLTLPEYVNIYSKNPSTPIHESDSEYWLMTSDGELVHCGGLYSDGYDYLYSPDEIAGVKPVITILKKNIDRTTTHENCFGFDGEGSITGYNIGSCTSNVVIPSKIGGVNVTRIMSGAFSSKGLRSVVIPFGVTIIGQGAFSGNQLTSVVIPSSVTSISTGAFKDNQLVSVAIPSSVTGIGDYAFEYNQLTSLVIPNSVTGIGMFAFSNNNLTSLVIPPSMKSIWIGTFANNQLTSVEIPSSVTSIAASAFANNQLTTIKIPSSVLEINDGAFSNNQLTSVTIPSSVTSIGFNAFQNNSITNLEISSGVKTIGDLAFQNNKLTSLQLPNSVTSIGTYAFANNNLTSLSLPASSPPLTMISEGAFEYNQLKSVGIPNSIVQIGLNAFRYNNLNGIVFGSSTGVIQKEAFYGNNLTGLVIPASVYVIGDSAFGFNKLTHVTVKGRSSFLSYGTNVFGWASGYSDANIVWNG